MGCYVIFIIESGSMNNFEFELPKLKSETEKEKKAINDNIIPEEKNAEIIVNDVSETIVIKNKRKSNLWILIISLLFTVFSLLLFLFAMFGEREVLTKKNKVSISDIEVVSYYFNNDHADIAIVPSSKQVYCAVTAEKVDESELDFQKLSNDKCYVSVPLEKQYVYFKSPNEVISKPLEVNNYVVGIDAEDKHYVPISTEHNIYDKLVVVGNPDVLWVSLDKVITVKGDKYHSDNIGKTKLRAMSNNKVVKEIEVVVTDVIVPLPKAFDTSRPYLSCEQFTADEAKLLDEILAFRIKQAGEGTRAGAVAAARFLTLEFPYKLSYYWESGRLNNTGKHYVDGEGRYYHKGLYLDKSKYKDIEASLFGPAMWGCLLRCYEDDPPHFVPGRKYPNGLDCSGFVTWSLYNGGFDVGDRGAGESPSKGQLTDLGDFRTLTKELINSGEIKVGDLFNFWGHISILIGEDKDNYYIAESLNNYKGLVVKKYPKKSVRETFKYVVLMDDVYKQDGNLTDMWY